MTYKLRHVVVLLFALVLGAVATYVEMNPLLRVSVAAFLLIPIIYAAEGLGISKLLSALPDPSVRSLSTPVRHSWELIREQSPVS